MTDAQRAVVVEEEDRRLIDVDEAEGELGELGEQRLDFRNARQRLRDLEQQRQFEPIALVLGNDGRRLIHCLLDAAGPEGPLQGLVGIRNRHLPDDRGTGARGTAHLLGRAVVDEHRAQIAQLEENLAEDHTISGNELRSGDAAAVDEGAIARAQVTQRDSRGLHRQLRVSSRDRGVEDGQVAAQRTPEYQGRTVAQLERQLAVVAHEAKRHRWEICRGASASPSAYSLARAPAPAAAHAPCSRSRPIRARERSRRRFPRRPV